MTQKQIKFSQALYDAEKEINVICKILDQKTKNKSLQEIADYLNENNIHIGNGKKWIVAPNEKK